MSRGRGTAEGGGDVNAWIAVVLGLVAGVALALVGVWAWIVKNVRLWS